jgi:hypothetical protein
MQMGDGVLAVPFSAPMMRRGRTDVTQDPQSRSGGEAEAGAPHTCNGSVQWGELSAVSRAPARKESGSAARQGRGRPGSGAKRSPGARGSQVTDFGVTHPTFGSLI